MPFQLNLLDKPDLCGFQPASKTGAHDTLAMSAINQLWD
jgi:hypothetical protein